MPTLDWLNRASAFNTAARAPYRLLEQVSVHAPTAAASAPAPSPLWGERGGEGLHPNAKPNSNFSHDNLQHAQWPSMVLPRLQLLRLQKVIDGEPGGISKAVNWAGGGGFRFMRLGEAVFDEAGRINPAVRFATLAAVIWQQETGAVFDPLQAKPGTPYLGTHYEFNSCLRSFSLGYEPISFIKIPKFACYLLFNGILKDKRPASGNVLTQAVLDALLALHATTPKPTAPLPVYGEACRLGQKRLKQANVTYEHIPYDVRVR